MFEADQYLIRRKILTFLGAKFHVYGPDGGLVAFTKMKAFKLKEDIRLYTDESMAAEVFHIQARNILDFGATYDVTDTRTGQHLGAFRRKALASMFRDEWHILDTQDREIGRITEDSLALALVRRFLVNLIPQNFTVTMGGRQVAQYRQNFNPFVSKITADFSHDYEGSYNREFGIAGAILLCVIEGKQK